MIYRKETNPNGSVTVWFVQDGVKYSFVDPSPGNTEYEAYAAWVAAGGVPETIEP